MQFLLMILFGQLRRYPQDNFDRIWTSDISIASSNVSLYRYVSTEEVISSNTEDFPPTAVMQTAWDVTYPYVRFNLPSFVGSKSLLLLYFAEIKTLNISASRSFYVTINGESLPETVTLARNYSTVELQFVSNQSDNFNLNQSYFYFRLSKAPNSTLLPIINAYEYYSLIDTQPATSSQDSKCPPNLIIAQLQIIRYLNE